MAFLITREVSIHCKCYTVDQTSSCPKRIVFSICGTAGFGPVQDDCFLLDPFTVCLEHCPETLGATSDPGNCRQHPANIGKHIIRIMRLPQDSCGKVIGRTSEREVNLSNCLFHLQVRQMASTIFQFLGDVREVADKQVATSDLNRAQWL